MRFHARWKERKSGRNGVFFFFLLPFFPLRVECVLQVSSLVVVGWAWAVVVWTTFFFFWRWGCCSSGCFPGVPTWPYRLTKKLPPFRRSRRKKKKEENMKNRKKSGTEIATWSAAQCVVFHAFVETLFDLCLFLSAGKQEIETTTKKKRNFQTAAVSTEGRKTIFWQGVKISIPDREPYAISTWSVFFSLFFFSQTCWTNAILPVPTVHHRSPFFFPRLIALCLLIVLFIYLLLHVKQHANQTSIWIYLNLSWLIICFSLFFLFLITIITFSLSLFFLFNTRAIALVYPSRTFFLVTACSL